MRNLLLINLFLLLLVYALPDLMVWAKIDVINAIMITMVVYPLTLCFICGSLIAWLFVKLEQREDQ